MVLKCHSAKILVLLDVCLLCNATFTKSTYTVSEDVMGNSIKMIDSVLSTILQNKCYALLLSDGTTSHNTIFKMDILRTAWGMSVFEITKTNQHFNHTQTPFSQVLSKVTQLRKVSWCMTILLVTDDPKFLTDFAHRSLIDRVLVWSTRLLIITRLPKEYITELLESHWTFSMMNTMALVIQPSLQNRCSLLMYLPYSPDGAQVVQAASWTHHKGLHYLNHLQIFPHKYSSFHGNTINISVLTYEPYWKILKTPNFYMYSGIDYNMLTALAQALNFTFRKLPTKTWGETEDMVESRKILMIPVMYSYLPTRYKRFDYTLFYDQSEVAFTMATPVVTPTWLSFYYPLSGEVWIAVLISTLLVCIIIVKITGSERWSSMYGKLSPGSVVLETVGCLLGQGLNGKVSTSRSNYIIIGTWLSFGVVISIAYRSSLITSLTVPWLPPTPSTVDQLVNAVDNITMESFNVYFRDFFSLSALTSYKRLGKMIHLTNDFTGALNDAIKSSTQGHIGSVMNLQLRVSKEFSRVDGTSPLYVGKANMLKPMIGWPLPHNAPYKHAVDNVLQYIIQAGLYGQWKKEELSAASREQRIKKRKELQKIKKYGKPENDSKDQKLRSLTLTHMQGPLLLLLIGLSLAAISFVVELMIH